MTYSSVPLRLIVAFAQEPEGPVHAVVRAVGSPHRKALTLCGRSLTGLQIAAEWEPMWEKSPGVPANPFFGPRGCEACAERLCL